MNLLRRTSTRRLLIAILAIGAIATASVAAFARDSGPKPPPRSLAAALHQAANVHPVQGVTARVQFSDRMLPSGSLGSG